MKIPTPRYQGTLGRLQSERMDPETIKRTGWREEHILVVKATDERLDFIERELVRRIGERLYGAGGRRRD